MPSRCDTGGAHDEGGPGPSTSVPGLRRLPAASHSQWGAYPDWAHSTATITYWRRSRRRSGRARPCEIRRPNATRCTRWRRRQAPTRPIHRRVAERACAPAHLRLRGLAQSKARAAVRESKGLAPRGAALALETAASAQAVEKWWAGLGSLARSEASRLVLHAHNLKFLLLRCGMRRATDPAACSATARRATHGHVGRMWQRGVGVASCDVRLLNFLLRRSPSPPARHRLTCLAKWMIERP